VTRHDENTTDDLQSALYLDKDVQELQLMEEDQSMIKQDEAENVDNETKEDINNLIDVDIGKLNESQDNVEILDRTTTHSELTVFNEKSLDHNVTTEETTCVDSLVHHSPSVVVQLNNVDAGAEIEGSAVHIIYLEDILAQTGDIANIDKEFKMGDSVIKDGAEIGNKLNINGETVANLDGSYLQTTDDLQNEELIRLENNKTCHVETVNETVPDTMETEEREENNLTTKPPEEVSKQCDCITKSVYSIMCAVILYTCI
jgi:hypothetical protein